MDTRPRFRVGERVSTPNGDGAVHADYDVERGGTSIRYVAVNLDGVVQAWLSRQVTAVSVNPDSDDR